MHDKLLSVDNNTEKQGNHSAEREEGVGRAELTIRSGLCDPPPAYQAEGGIGQVGGQDRRLHWVESGLTFTEMQNIQPCLSSEWENSACCRGRNWVFMETTR